MTETFDKYSVTQYPISSILGSIEAGDIAIPEIQRPFVWKGKQVRDLIDSLFNGYPTGYLIIWQNPDVKLKNGKDSIGKKVIIDGQQRITALMTAIAGVPILTEDYQTKRIKIAFNPLAKEGEERFAVQSAAHTNSRIWIDDIALLFKHDFDSFGFVCEYTKANPEVTPQDINRSITRLQAIRGCQLGAITLVPQLDIEAVTEIFVRINSQGKRLDQADFAMSKIAADERYGGNMLRKAIDYFCHLAIEPNFYGQLQNGDKEFMGSDYEKRLRWLKDDNDSIYDPDYNDMLRVSFMHIFDRGKLGDLVSLLSGRDFKDKSFKDEIAEDSFAKLRVGVLNFMNQYNFENFVLAIRSAGYISNKLLNSKMTMDFAYTLFLKLRDSKCVDNNKIKQYVQKWFVLSTLTSRYIGSPESQMDRDLRSIDEKGFVAFFEENERSMLSDDFWRVRLVQNLETSSINSPYFNTFVAAQIFGGDKSLFSNSAAVRDLVEVTGDVHHIFPKQYLKDNGVVDKSKYNQVANYVYLDTGVNISIGKKAPNDYFKVAFAQCDGSAINIGTIANRELLEQNLRVNCIDTSIADMTASSYDDFLVARRELMAEKIKEYYFSL